MKDGPFQGNLERAVLQVAGTTAKIEFQREKGFQGLYLPAAGRFANPEVNKKDEYTEYSHGSSSEARKGIA